MEIWFIDNLPTICGIGIGVAGLIYVISRLKDALDWKFSRELNSVLFGIFVGSMTFVFTVNFLYLDDYNEVKNGVGKQAWEEDQLRQWERHVVSCDGVSETYLSTMDGLNSNGKILLSRQFKVLHPECDARMKNLMEERIKGVLKK